ncbi:MAG TPA: hypothetical protein VGR62_04800 [Candidatus Binatia bacterium]|nr:hypothetical protein [Candidatus Binatia bacterium]
MIRAALVALLLASAPAWALTPGGGSPTTDCLAEFGGTPANVPTKNPKEIRCIDNDPTCDDDPDLGVCGFRLSVCLNVGDPRFPACTAADLEDYTVENEQPDTNPLHDFDLQGLEDQIAFSTLPVESTQQNVCSNEVGVSVYLPIRIRTGSAVWRRGKKQVRSTLSGPGGAVDEDRMKLTCMPAEDTTACDGVTSTFDQLQKHVFTPTSCSRSTCHNVRQDPHDMSLSPGEAYENLVGVVPANPVASAAGKLRVDPGNVANSFIVQKLRGLLAPGEGVRMPFGLKHLKELDIRVLEEWIAAGAPETGFVSATGCQP